VKLRRRAQRFYRELEPRELEPVKRHRHEASMWFICGGTLAWCYQCGAIRFRSHKRWLRPTGLGGVNPWSKVKQENLK
jgi:hypothetical protein